MTEPDRHIRRGPDEYEHALAQLLPQGIAWPREPDSILMQTVRGLAAVWGFVDSRAADLLERETDPRLAMELFPEWERAWGLPDLCPAEPAPLEQRRRALMTKMTRLGAQSREFFIALAAEVGYTIRISEYAPYMCGISEVGDTTDEWDDPRWECGPEEIRFHWKVHVQDSRLSWFRVTSGEAGVDPHLMIGIACDLELVLRRNAPAHTIIIFDYSGMTVGGEFAGLP